MADVTDRHRKAARAWWDWQHVGSPSGEEWDAIDAHAAGLAQGEADERAAIVAWLREVARDSEIGRRVRLDHGGEAVGLMLVLGVLADAIEKGDHRKP